MKNQVRKHLIRIHTALPAILALALTGCWMESWTEDSGATGLDYAQVGFIYVGPVGDHGWTKSHDDGRIFLEANVPDVTTEYAASVASADAAEVMEGFIANGDNVIFTTSFDFLTPTLEIAGNNPDTLFESCSGFVSLPNLGSYFGRMQQAWFLAGMVAGEMTTQNKIGSVSPVVIPETVRHLNAFVLGVRSVNPAATVEVKWVNAWFDVKLEPQYTIELLENGVDIIASETDTIIPLQTVQDYVPKKDPGYDIWSIGYDNADSCTLAGDRCLTSPYWNWGPLYSRIVSEMIAGTWDPEEFIWDAIKTDVEESTIGLAEMNSAVPQAFQMTVWEKLADFAKAENTQAPFIGPIYDNKGTLRVPEGDQLTDEELLRICWFVEGVVDAKGQPATVPSGCGGDT